MCAYLTELITLKGHKTSQIILHTLLVLVVSVLGYVIKLVEWRQGRL